MAISRRCKICSGVSALIIILLLVAFLVIFFTILKPKQPKVLGHKVFLQSIDLEPLPVFKLNVSLLLVIAIKNQNYGSFKYTNGTASVYYHGEEVAAAQIEDGEIPARASHDVSSSVDVLAEKLIINPYVLPELTTTGWLNFTSSSTMRGKASLFNILKTWATATTDCSISLSLSKTMESYCHSKAASQHDEGFFYANSTEYDQLNEYVVV